MASLRFCLSQACILQIPVIACSCLWAIRCQLKACSEKAPKQRSSKISTEKAAGSPERPSLLCPPLPSSAAATLQFMTSREWEVWQSEPGSKEEIPLLLQSVIPPWRLLSRECVRTLSLVSLQGGLWYYYYFKYSLPWGGETHKEGAGKQPISQKKRASLAAQELASRKCAV